MKWCSAEDQGYRGPGRRSNCVRVRLVCLVQTTEPLQSKAPTEKPWQLCQGVQTPFTEQWECFYQTRPRKNVNKSHSCKPVYNKEPCHFAWKMRNHYTLPVVRFSSLHEYIHQPHEMWKWKRAQCLRLWYPWSLTVTKTAVYDFWKSGENKSHVQMHTAGHPGSRSPVLNNRMARGAASALSLTCTTSSHQSCYISCNWYPSPDEHRGIVGVLPNSRSSSSMPI